LQDFSRISGKLAMCYHS